MGLFASKPAPTVSTEYTCQKLVGCQAAIAGKPAPTKQRKPDQKIAACGSSYRGNRYNPHAAKSAPLNRMIVSSAAAFDLDPRATSEG